MEKPNLWNAFTTDPNLESKAGIVLDYGQFGQVRILRAGGANLRFAKVREEVLLPYKLQVQSGLMDDATMKKLLIDIYARTIVIGMEGVEGPDGKLLEFNRENVKKVLGIDAVMNDIMRAAGDYQLFRKKDDEPAEAADPATAPAADPVSSTTVPDAPAASAAPAAVAA